MTTFKLSQKHSATWSSTQVYSQNKASCYRPFKTIVALKDLKSGLQYVAFSRSCPERSHDTSCTPSPTKVILQIEAPHRFHSDVAPNTDTHSTRSHTFSKV